mmetsp:Transcript_62357/g.179354  ORF Transcript_62357/g.179354 Transcript_62357/m.179354 type:complete len:214 (-) Transcript_62357:173-814(-)
MLRTTWRSRIPRRPPTPTRTRPTWRARPQTPRPPRRIWNTFRSRYASAAKAWSRRVALTPRNARRELMWSSGRRRRCRLKMCSLSWTSSSARLRRTSPIVARCRIATAMAPALQWPAPSLSWIARGRTRARRSVSRPRTRCPTAPRRRPVQQQHICSSQAVPLPRCRAAPLARRRCHRPPTATHCFTRRGGHRQLRRHVLRRAGTPLVARRRP